MKRIDAGERKTLCANSDSPFFYFGWPSIGRLPDGALAMAASGYRLEHICPFGKAVIAYSRDEGESWTRPAAVIDTPLDDRDSGIVAFGKGRVIFTSFNNTVAMQRNWNINRHASASPVDRAKAKLMDAYLEYIETLGGDPNRYYGPTYCISEDGGYTFPAVRNAPVTSPHGPAKLNDGSLLWIGNRLPANGENSHGILPVECWHMDADGQEFTLVSALDEVQGEDGALFCDEPHAIQLADGRIIVHFRIEGGKTRRLFTVYQSVSEDGGKTFTKPVQLLGDRGGSPAHLFMHSSGTLISAYGYREAPYGVRLMFSTDGGRSWDTDWVLDDRGQSGDLGYPATVELKDGSLLTVWYENRDGESRILQRKWTLPEAFAGKAR